MNKARSMILPHGLRLTALTFCLAVAFPGLAADIQRVSSADGKTVALENGEKKPIKENFQLTPTIEVRTNATYVVGGGDPRKLEEGFILDREGMLTSPNGSTQPVVDHLTTRQGQLILFKDGQTTTLKTDYIMPNGTRIKPSGEMRLPNGQLQRLIDGQILTLDGAVMASKDTVTLRDGKVFVQRDGSQFPLRPNQSMMMNDGTKVFADGRILKADGETITLHEGQVVKLEGNIPRKR